MSESSNLKKPVALIVLAAIFFVAFFVYLNSARYRSLFAFEWGDESVHNQLAWRTFRHGMFTSTLKGGQIFDQHFRPIWLLVALPYLICPSIHAWYFLLALSFAGAAILFYFWALRSRGDPWAALLFALVFLLYPPIHQLLIGVFDPEKLAVFFIMGMILAMERGRFGWFVTLAILAMCCKEIVGFTLVLFGISAFALKKPPRFGIAAIAIAVVWMAVAFVLIIPSTMDVGYGDKYFPQLLGAECGSMFCVILEALQHPVRTIGVVLSPDHLKMLALLLLPLGALMFLSPLVAFPALASLGMILAVPGRMLINQHHWFATGLPFLFAASVIGASKTAGWIAKGDDDKEVRIFRIIPIVLIGLSLVFGAVGGFVGGFHNDVKDDDSYEGLSSIFDSRIYHVSERDKKAWELIGRIPSSASVAANYDLMVPLATREKIYEFGRHVPGHDVFDVDYFLINLQDRYYGAGHDVRLNPPILEELIKRVQDGRIEVLYADSNFFLGKTQLEPQDAPFTPEVIGLLQNAADVARAKLAAEGVSDIRD